LVPESKSKFDQEKFRSFFRRKIARPPAHLGPELGRIGRGDWYQGRDGGFLLFPPKKNITAVLSPQSYKQGGFFGSKQILPQKVQNPFEKDPQKIFSGPLAGTIRYQDQTKCRDAFAYGLSWSFIQDFP